MHENGSCIPNFCNPIQILNLIIQTHHNYHYKAYPIINNHPKHLYQNLTTQNLIFHSFSTPISIPLFQTPNLSWNWHPNSIHKLSRASKLGMGPITQLLKFDPTLDLPQGQISQNCHFSFSLFTKAPNHFKTLNITNYYLVDPYRSQLGQLLATQGTTPKFMVLIFFNSKL